MQAATSTRRRRPAVERTYRRVVTQHHPLRLLTNTPFVSAKPHVYHVARQIDSAQVTAVAMRLGTAELLQWPFLANTLSPTGEIGYSVGPRVLSLF